MALKNTGIYDADVIAEKGVPVNKGAINQNMFDAADLKRYNEYKKNKANEITQENIESYPQNNVEPENNDATLQEPTYSRK